MSNRTEPFPPDVPPPLVSVVLTVFRRTRFVGEALRSVLTQDVADLEVVVADDSDSPAIRALVEAAADPRVRYQPSRPRKGVARNVADALATCRGTFVAILNDDDTWEPDFLPALLAPLRADPACVLAFSDHWVMDERGTIDAAETERQSRRGGRARLPAGPVAVPGRVAALDKAVPLVMGSLFRKAALDAVPGWGLDGAGIPEPAGGAYDYWLAVALAATGGTLHYVPRRLTRYRLHDAMETRRPRPNKREDELFILREILARAWFPDLRRPLRARLAALCGSVAINRLRFGQPAAARTMALAGLRAAPNPRCLAVLLASLSPVLPRRLLFGRDHRADA